MAYHWNPFTGQLDDIGTDIAGAVTSVSGTTNRITSSGGTTPVIDISASYVGQSSITTVGTLSSGAIPTTLLTGVLVNTQFPALTGDITTVAGALATTLATVISAGGPTGSATVTPIITYDAKGRLTAVSSATITPAASSITGGQALSKTDDTNVTLTLGGSPTTALLAATSLTLGWTGTLGVARGGTNIASYAVGDLIYASGTTTLAKLADVATGSVLISGGVTTAPAWSTTPTFVGTNISGTAASLTAGKATILATARTIAGVSFDGSANIAIASTGLSDTANIAYINAANTFTNATQTIQTGVNGALGGFAENTTSGTAAYAVWRAHAGTSFIGMYAISQGYTTSNEVIASSGLLEASGVGGLVLSSNAGPTQFFVNGGSTPSMAIAATGNVGIGTTNPGYKLEVNGTVAFTALTADTASTDRSLCQDTTSKEVKTGTGVGGLCLGTSSERYKDRIDDLKVGLKEILNLRPVDFFYKEGYGSTDKKYYGLIAEEMVKVLPELVGLNEDKEPNTADLLGLVPVLIKAVQEQQAVIEILTDRINTLANV